MKVAFCFYGQPREYIAGYENIMQHLKKFPDIQFDFYYHTWYTKTDSTKYYEGSARNYTSEKNRNHLKIDNDILDKLNKLYNPIDFCYDEPIVFDKSLYIDSLCYKKSEECNKQQMNNILSQFYSYKRVKELLMTNLNERNINYDYVIAARFDFKNVPTINLYNIDINKVYCNNFWGSRRLYIPNYNILSIDNFCKFFNVFDNITKLLNNISINELMIQTNELLQCSAEKIMTANIYYEFNMIPNIFDTLIEYTHEIPNCINE